MNSLEDRIKLLIGSLVIDGERYKIEIETLRAENLRLQNYIPQQEEQPPVKE